MPEARVFFNPGIYARVERISQSPISAVGTTHFKLQLASTINKKLIKHFRIVVISTIFVAMRKIIPILFILLLSAPFWGTFSWLKMEKHFVRKSIKHQIIDGIDHDLLVLKSFAKKDTSSLLEWKHDKEFSLNGEMYDIVQRTYTKDSVHYTLWWDNEETQLNIRLTQLTNNFFDQNPDSQNKSNYFGFVMKHIYSFDSPETAIIKTEKQTDYGWLYLDKKPSKYTSVDSPPPKILIQFT